MTAQTLAAALSQLFQSNWSLGSPAVGDILWTDTKPDLMQLPQWTKNYVVGVYNPPNPVVTKPLCRELWQIFEHVYADVYVKVTSTVDAAAVIRETIRAEIYRIAHTQEFQVAGQKNVDIVREPHKIESPEMVRLAIELAGESWDIRT
jgi:hypothetical protein